MTKLAAFGALAATVALSACDAMSQAMTAHTDVVARAGGLELTVDEAVGLLAQNPRLPAESEVVEAVANLWVDYVLLATEASRDSTLASLDVGPVIDPVLEQQLFVKLNEQVIQVDTALGDEELREVYEREKPGAQIRARHILLRSGPEASSAQRDSTLALARDLRARAAAGQDFAKLAEEYSQDPGSARDGGDLGFFERGQMVAPFEEAAFALGVGEVSDVVETPFGFHVIKVEEHRMSSFEEVKDSFRAQTLQRRVVEAQEAYVETLTGSLGIKVDASATAVARDLASKPEMQLSGRAASRALVSYEDGALTAAEYLAFIRSRTTPSNRAQLAAMTDDNLESVLEGLTRNEVLLAEARRQGLEITAAERDSVANEVRAQLAGVTRSVGLAGIEPQDGETMKQAIERRVMSFLEGVVRGDQQVFNLGSLTFPLREQGDAEIFTRAVPKVVQGIQANRPTPATPQAPIEPEPDSGAAR